MIESNYGNYIEHKSLQALIMHDAAHTHIHDNRCVFLVWLIVLG